MIRFLQFLIVGLFFWGGDAQAVRVVIDRGHFAPIPLALTKVYPADSEIYDLSQKLEKVVQKDLRSCGQFKLIDPLAFIQNLESLHRDGPRFGDWRILHAQALTRVKVENRDRKNFKVTLSLYDVFTQKVLEEIAYLGPKDEWRKMSHRIADKIYERLTGEQGYFDTKLVFVEESGPRTRRQRRLMMVDQDGENLKSLTKKGRTIVMTPRISPKGNRLVYLDFGERNRVPRVRIMDMKSKKHQTLGKFPGMTYSPRFSHDGRKVVLSFSQSGNSSLYEMDLVSRRVKRLSYGDVIDTSPSYSPDDRKIVFSSNRPGNVQIYVMDSNGQNLKRISYGPGRYATPVWSPRGDLIAFTKQYKGQFYIGVMRPDGTGERLLTTGDVVEDPEWAPGGQMILFTRTNPRRRGQSKLNIIDLSGFNERRVPLKAEGSGGSWVGSR